jgi:lambda family phage portal protein
VLGPDGKVNAVFARTVETAWEAWQEQACANGDQFVDVQRLVAGHLFEDGEILVRRVRKAPLQIEVLECDHLDIGKDTPDTGNGGRIVGGIEFGADGSRLAYWITPRHPGEQVSQSTRVPASEVLHIFDRRRASQARGISMFASVISELFDTCEYQDATMTLARVATAYGIFVESQNPEDFMPQNDGLGKAEDGETPLQYVNPGGIHYLRPGEKINTVKAEQPGAVYSEFVRSRLRAASAGSGMSYETFSNDYSQTNYSSARQALIQERALFRYFSGLIDRRLNVPIYRWWLDSQEVVRAVVMPGYDSDPRKFHAVKFSRPRQEWIDPAKEANAAEKRLSIGMETLTDLCEAEGRDVDEVFETRAAEVERMKALGIFQLDKPAQSEPEAEPAEENI